MKNPKLIIFDFDETLLEHSDSCKRIYSDTLEKLVLKEKGEYGLKVLHDSREKFGGKIDQALSILGVPFKSWLAILADADINAIKEDKNLVNNIIKLESKKVIYSGSPEKLIRRIIKKIGFSETDFDLIAGWKEPEEFPLKWEKSSSFFEKIIIEMGFNAGEILAVGDNWEYDLFPANIVGIKTALIAKDKEGSPNFHFSSIDEFIEYFTGNDL